jgi:TetR/AcrR family transcriptional regulator, transcriptional repressor of aconitase
VPKVSQEHLDARREEILEGARRAFARHGYEGATVAKLEEEIGVSRGAIFHYFPDKWSLFFELAARDQHELLTMLVEQGLDATLRHLTTESPDWMGVYLEVTRHLREDVSREDLVAFINIVANGAALARALDLELNADALVKLFHTGIDPPRQ